MKSLACKCLFAILGWIWINSIAAAVPTAWQTLAPGLEYTRFGDFPGFPAGYVHAFRIDLNHYRLQVGNANQGFPLAIDFKQLMAKTQAVVATNGGFFAPNLTSLGLRISGGQVLSPLRPISWWSVFYIRNNQADVVMAKSYAINTATDFAVEAGPRLIANGKIINSLKPGSDDRTALGVTTKGKVILLATENLLLTTVDLANLMQNSSQHGGLDCREAINLDGGSSTQMYAQVANFSLDIPSFSRVADAVLVVPSLLEKPQK